MMVHAFVCDTMITVMTRYVNEKIILLFLLTDASKT